MQTHPHSQALLGTKCIAKREKFVKIQHSKKHAGVWLATRLNVISIPIKRCDGGSPFLDGKSAMTVLCLVNRIVNQSCLLEETANLSSVGRAAILITSVCLLSDPRSFYIKGQPPPTPVPQTKGEITQWD
ncbi:hypothetical protein CDAR_366721 [Caerostris darwini]|uniref:Uncharacterized protein n=1 Tax=Caerostris darwini TaxID=1538125 RepID=A0AAV4Q3C0_9ARAC|nr:hypothetical protein CDAR_366721 [Caerostris darwini]